MPDAPPIRWEHRPDGIVVLVLDEPGRVDNTFSAAYRACMAAVLDRLEAERDHITGVVITSGKECFFAGPDIGTVLAADGDTAALTAATSELAAQLRRLERLGRPVVAAINGTALGGGMAIALACQHRIAAGAPGIVLGMPEVRLGLLPAAGGLVRAVRMLGIARALSDLLLGGALYTPEQALALGLVDEVVPASGLTDHAVAWALRHPDGLPQPWDTPGHQIPGGAPYSAMLAATLPVLPSALRADVRGAPAPAPRAILAAAVEGAQVDLENAALIEARYFVGLATSPAAANMTRLYAVDLPGLGNGLAGGGSAGALPGHGRAGSVSPGLPSLAWLPPVNPADGSGTCGQRRALAEPGTWAGRFVRPVLGAYLAEAAAMVGEGVEPVTVEQAAAQAGFTWTPLNLADEIGLTVAAAMAAGARPPDGPAAGEWAAEGGAVAARLGGSRGGAVMTRLVSEFGRRGAGSGGGGFYCYGARGERDRLWPGLREAFGSGSVRPDFAGLQERLLCSAAAQALRCLSAGRAPSVAWANLLSLAWVGFPPWTGGVIQYINQFPGGPEGFAARAAALAL
jgi:enoyl-CoA hydratase/carnithine racemase